MLDIEPIKKREQAATKGPWHYGTDSCECGGGYGCSHSDWAHEVWCAKPEPDPSWSEAEKKFRSLINGKYQYPIIEEMCCNIDDAEFFTHARTDIPALLDELERTRAAAKELRKMVKEHRWFMLNRDEWPTMATQESWNNIIQDTEWLEELG